MAEGWAGVPRRPPLLLAAALAVALLVAGCAGPASTGPRLRDDTTVAQVLLEGSLEREETRPGDALVSNFHVTNRGATVVYQEGGCASAPFTFEIRAENGTLVAPLGPDPRCLADPTPLAPRVIARGEAISHAFSWDANRKWFAQNGTVMREPAAPGLYTLRADVTVERDGARIQPAVELVFRVLAG